MVKEKKNKRILKKKLVKKQKTLKKIKESVVKSKPKKKKQKKVKVIISDNAYQTKIKVIGIGGGGGSIVSDIASQLKKVSFVAANTDTQALKRINKKCRRFSFGRNLTGGLGCGMNPELGKRAAKQATDDIKKILDGADLCILVSSLGGGTGSGASPIFAELSSELKNITFGIFTLPFKFEGEKKLKIALNSLEEIKSNLNAFIVIPNEKIFKIIDKKTPLKQSLSTLNKILGQGLEGLIEMIFLPGLINIDWADLKVILEGKGKLCFLNSIEAGSDEVPEETVRRLIKNPLSEYNSEKADKILYNITSDKDLKMETVEQISRAITGVNKKAKIIFGISQHPNYKKKIRITLLATSDERKETKIKRKPKLKIEPEPEQESEEKPEEEKKPKEKISQLKKKRPKKKKIIKIKIKKDKKEEITEEHIKKQEKTRKNALQLKKEAEEAEKEILEGEKKWDIPAFLRRGNE
ncbi:MAG: cell division protein FtsZ [Minisyncoccales bacterium]